MLRMNSMLKMLLFIMLLIVMLVWLVQDDLIFIVSFGVLVLKVIIVRLMIIGDIFSMDVRWDVFWISSFVFIIRNIKLVINSNIIISILIVG